MRDLQLVDGEYYHVYNRGVDGRSITQGKFDSDRFLESLLLLFNCTELTGSIYAHTKAQSIKKKEKDLPLVEIIAYCLNPNHYHLILKQVATRGIERLMQRVGTGYTKYFNETHDRKGSLFLGPYKAVHVDSNEYLLHLSAYVNMNDGVHKLSVRVKKLVRSSWDEYMGKGYGMCQKDIVLSQFRGKEEYRAFVKESLFLSWQAKIDQKEREALGIED